MLTLLELESYSEWARAKLKADPALGYRALGTLLRAEQGVNAHPRTLGRWLASLQPPVLGLAGLAAYDDWAKAKLAADPGLGYRQMGTLLRSEHGAAADKRTIQRWLTTLQAAPAAPAAAPPKPRSLKLGELEAYSDWARARLAAQPALGHWALRTLLVADHNVTAADNTMRRWAEPLRPLPIRILTLNELARYASWGRGILETQPDAGYRAILSRLQDPSIADTQTQTQTHRHTDTQTHARTHTQTQTDTDTDTDTDGTRAGRGRDEDGLRDEDGAGQGRDGTR